MTIPEKILCLSDTIERVQRRTEAAPLRRLAAHLEKIVEKQGEK